MTAKRRLLDLFCGAGGASKGYTDAGFEVVGVDKDPQPNYPFEFIQADAMTFPLDGFDAAHGSPPCHDHSTLNFRRGGKKAPYGTGWMLAATIERLHASGLPYVVENVPGATTMAGTFTLCARSFGIARLKRHRKFLTSTLMAPPPCACRQYQHVQTIGVYGDLSRNDRKITNAIDGYVRMRAGVATARELLGCPWMDAKELTQAIPPVYTEWIGRQIMAALDLTAVRVA